MFLCLFCICCAFKWAPYFCLCFSVPGTYPYLLVSPIISDTPSHVVSSLCIYLDILCKFFPTHGNHNRSAFTPDLVPWKTILVKDTALPFYRISPAIRRGVHLFPNSGILYRTDNKPFNDTYSPVSRWIHLPRRWLRRSNQIHPQLMTSNVP